MPVCLNSEHTGRRCVAPNRGGLNSATESLNTFTGSRSVCPGSPQCLTVFLNRFDPVKPLRLQNFAMELQVFRLTHHTARPY